MPLARAQRQFAAAGQMLALDPFLGARHEATIGGVLATADSGPLRHRYGAPRDLVLGMTVVLSDGTVARSGGKVIKNVAGYDLGEAVLRVVRDARADPRGQRAPASAAARAPRPWWATAPTPARWLAPRARSRRRRSSSRRSTSPGAERGAACSRSARAPPSEPRGRRIAGADARRAGSTASRSSTTTPSCGRASAPVSGPRAACSCTSPRGRARSPASSRRCGEPTRRPSGAPRSATRSSTPIPRRSTRCSSACPAGAVPVLLDAPDELRGTVELWGPAPRRARAGADAADQAPLRPGTDLQPRGCSLAASRRREHRRGLRPLRLLPGDLPDLRAVGQRGRLAAGADRADRRRPREPGSVSDEMVTHIDRCLGCMACVTACPSGVRYDRLIERTRPKIERGHRRPRSRAAAARGPVRDPPPPPAAARAGAADRGGPQAGRRDRLPGRAGAMAALAPRTPCAGRCGRGIPELTPAVGARRGRVALLLGCVQRVFYPAVHRATIGVLAAEGFEVLAPRACPECCGALELHAGEEEAAVARARATIAAFGDAGRARPRRHVSAAGCGSAMKEYGELLGTAEARAFAGAGARRQRGARLGGAPGAAGTGAAAGRLPRRLPPGSRPEGPRAAARAAARDPGSRAARGTGPSARSAAARRASTTCSSPRRPPSSARARPATCSRPAREAIAAGNPGCAAQLDVSPARARAAATDHPSGRARVALDQGGGALTPPSPRTVLDFGHSMS